MPLRDIKVLDLSRYLPGPQTAALLGDYGAQVIRIENPRHAANRDQALGLQGMTGPERTRAQACDLSGRNKTLVTLDIFAQDGRAKLSEMLGDADVLIHDYRRSTLTKAALTPADIHRQNPSLIYVGLSATGTNGPRADAPGHDPIALALSGALTRTGETPQFLGFPPADILTAAHTAFAIMVALHHRAAHPPQSPDQAITLDAAMSDSALSLMTSVFARQQRTGTEPPQDFPIGDNWIFETSDQRHVAATNMERPFWDRFCSLVDRPDLIGRFTGGDRPALRQELQEIYLTRTRDEWDAFATQNDLQIAPVLSAAEALTDPHHHARRALHQMGNVVIPGRPVHMTGVPETTPRPSQKGAGT